MKKNLFALIFVIEVSGVYIYQIKNDDFTVKGKMLFVK